MNIIEIGAYDGGHTSNFFKDAMIWSFEPNPILANKLRYKFKDSINIHIIEKAVSDFNGTSTFNISVDEQSSSIYPLTNFAKNNTIIKYKSEIMVDVIRMDTFLNEINIDIVDYFHCDAQGNDLTILKSFEDKISQIQMGKIEVSLREELYLNTSNKLEEALDFLNDNNFKISNLEEINIHKLNLNRYDCNIEFYQKNKKII